MKRLKVFVAGGSGFLGKRIIKRLETKKIPYVTTSLSLGTDFTDMKQTLAFYKKHQPTVVIHAAAYVGGITFGIEHAGEIYYKNIIASTNLIEAARLSGVKKFINTIGNCSYPDVKNRIFKEEEFWNGPLHPSVAAYGIVRKAQYLQSVAYHNQYGMNFANLILPNMYGPNDHFNETRSHALGALLMKIATAKENNIPQVIVWGTGKPIREWLHVDDGAEALIRAMKVDTGIEPINIGVGKGISIKELALLIKEIVGYKGKLVFDRTKPDGAPYKIMDIRKCKRIFGWIPNTPLEEGILQTYKWYMKNKHA